MTSEAETSTHRERLIRTVCICVYNMLLFKPTHKLMMTLAAFIIIKRTASTTTEPVDHNTEEVITLF